MRPAAEVEGEVEDREFLERVSRVLAQAPPHLVSGFEFRVTALGFRCSALGFRVSEIGFRV